MYPAVLVMTVAGATSGCLVTDSPDFSPPARTAPQLFPVLPTTEFIRALTGESGYQLPKFDANVLSEDAGDDLESALLIDYGVEGPGGDPWLTATPGPTLPARSLADGPRLVSAGWNPFNFGAGCHTVTMMVTHAKWGVNPGYWCPKEANDYATLTWVVALCGADVSSCTFDDCPIRGDDTYIYCSSVTGTP